MHNVEFKVSTKGQARVRKEKRKNVHATVAGSFYDNTNTKFDLKGYSEVYYNPYKTDTFVDKSGNPIYRAEEAICCNNAIYIKTI